MIPVTGQAGIETQPLTPEPACSSHKLHCLTAEHHLLCTEPDSREQKPKQKSSKREVENTKRDAGDLRRNSLSCKGLCLFLGLGLSSFAAFPLTLDVRLHRAGHSGISSSYEHTSKNFRCSWCSNQKPATQGL